MVYNIIVCHDNGLSSSGIDDNATSSSDIDDNGLSFRGIDNCRSVI